MGACLDSVRELTDDIVVVDAESRDRTDEVCRANGARVFTRRWTGFSDQKNFGNAQARHDWILSLDADERLTPELAASIRREFAHGPPGRDAYAIRFQNYFAGHHVRFGAWNPEWHARLFDRRKCDWNTDDVHEGLRGVEGCRLGRLHGRIRHLTAASRAELAEKSRRYGELFALKLRRQGRAPGWTKIWLNPAWRFSRDLLLRLGALDGAAGWAIAWEAAHYTHLKYRLALPEPRPRHPVAWLAPATVAAMLLAFLTVLPGLTFREMRTDADPSVKGAMQLSISNQAAGSISPLDSDEDDLRRILPDDEDDVLI